MRVLIALLVVLLLTGCMGNGVRAPNPFPADVDLADCTYPMRTHDSDAALSDAYLKALGQIRLCNSRLSGVREAKSKFDELQED